MPLRIVAYTTGQENSFWVDNLARCINGRTKNMCRCIQGNAEGGRILFDDEREWIRAPQAIHDELESADLIIQSAGPIAPQHRSMLASKPILALDPCPGAGGAFLSVAENASSLPGFVPFPVPLWESEYSLSDKGPNISLCCTKNGDGWPEKVRQAHLFVDRGLPGGGSLSSFAALAVGCVVVNGFQSNRFYRATLRALTDSKVDPPFLCAAPQTLEPLLACLIGMGPAQLTEMGKLNRRWLEQQWDFARQWATIWTPLVQSVLGRRQTVSSPHSWRQPTPSVQPRKSVSVIIVTRNEGVYLRRTVHSLRESLGAGDEIVVVDDQSTDGSAEILQGAYEGVQVLRPDARLGVAAARNYGARQAGGDVLVFSDAHIEVPKDWAAPVVDALARTDTGAVTPALCNLHFRAGKGVCGGRWRQGTHDYLRWQWLPAQEETPYPVPLLSGGFLSVRRDVFEAIGGFDAGMWMYGVEDAELSVRLWTLGYRCLALPGVRIAHRFNRPARRAACDYKSNSEIYIHNKMRLAVLHFSPERIERMVEYVATNPMFPAALARLASGDAWIRRAELQRLRQYDDDWYFRRFEMPL